MILKAVSEPREIRKYVRQFVRSFKPFIDEQIKIKLGHQGASFPAKVFYCSKLSLWMLFRVTKNVKYWNVFGIGKPQAGSLLPITAEINFPWSAIDRKIGAAFAKDLLGNVFVIHRGKIGGGKKGIGKSFFEHHYRGLWVPMEDGDSLAQVAVIGSLNSPRLALQTALFIKKIEILKSIATHSPQTEFNFPEITFHEDLIGDFPSAMESDINDQCDYGLIVSALADLFLRWKLSAGNDNSYALYLADSVGNRISHIFAVHAGGKEDNILAAAAKLLIQTKNHQDKPLPVLCLPESEINSYAQMLHDIGVMTIGFRLENEQVFFPGLTKIKLDLMSQL